MHPDMLEQLLAQVMQPEKIREAEEALKRALATPTFMCDLAERLRASQSPQVRQLATVLMRRRIGSHWTKLDAQTQHALKAALLQSVTSETVHLVRVGVANVVAVIAKHTLPKGQWNELFEGLFAFTRRASNRMRLWIAGI